jgi:hypothetical protein
MYDLCLNEVECVEGGLAKCEMSTATKVQLTVLGAFNPLLGLGFVAMYYAARDC